MTKEIEIKQERSLTQGMTREQIELIKNTVARNATDDELKLFLYTATRSGLDPLTKQIHFIKRRVWNKAKNGYDEVGTIQTGIDGYRAVASRNGLAGIDDPIFDSEEGDHPNKATVVVYKMIGDLRVSFTASAFWKEYVQTNKEGQAQAMWKKMPYLMLGKVAEALALRKGFPNDLSGIYTTEEMTQADAVPVVDLETQEHVPMTPYQVIPREIVIQIDEDAAEVRKDRIKDLMRSLDKPCKKSIVKEVTGFDFEERNYAAIVIKLEQIIDGTDPLASAIKSIE